MRAPPELRFVLATPADPAAGAAPAAARGELSEIRTADLQFITRAEARELLTAAGVHRPALRAGDVPHERAEGWAAGLRLAALSLAGHEDPERFAAEFSGSERTVADYLLAEVLSDSPMRVRRLLLRTSVLEQGVRRARWPDALTGGSGGERMLAELEQANAFVVSLDCAGRSWFRYHHLFADPLQLALRRTTPGEVTALHLGSCRVVRGARVPGGGDPPCAGGTGLGPGCPAARRSLARPAPGRASRHRARNPGRVPRRGHRGGLELATAWLRRMSWRRARWRRRSACLGWRRGDSKGRRRCQAGRRGQAHLLLGVVRLLLARQHGNLPAVAEGGAAAAGPD